MRLTKQNLCTITFHLFLDYFNINYLVKYSILMTKTWNNMQNVKIVRNYLSFVHFGSERVEGI